MLDERLIRQLKEAQQKLSAQGTLPSRAQLTAWYDTFRARFGPERLRDLDGHELLSTLHDHSRRDSLVYWLEFKNDEEFPAIFGSIAGGSALKFGIYKRKETGAWMTGSPMDQRELSLDEAIQVARRNRDQLLRAAALVAQMPANASDTDYLQLQHRLDAVAADFSDSAWGHKYLSLLFPEKLDDYHNTNYQRFHLRKLLQVIPNRPGRYLLAGRFIAAANALGMPVNFFTRTLNHVNGDPHRYWRVGTSDGVAPANRWVLMRDGGCVAIGWPLLGDLSGIPRDREGKDRIRQLLTQHYENVTQQLTKNTNQVFNFALTMQEHDLVLAAQGRRILGIARVTGGYSFDSSSDFPHRRQVEWLSLDPFELPQAGEGLQTTFLELDDEMNLVDIERRLLGAPKLKGSAKPPPASGPHPLPALVGMQGRIQTVLERKGQAILYGPPGTGKTYLAEQAVRELAAQAAFGAPFSSLTQEQTAVITRGSDEDGPLVRMCSFHPAYGYEEFLEGYRPRGDGGQMRFELRDGIFKRLCTDARRRPHLRFYLIVDEINRGDIPRIMGELLTVLEKSKRGKPILLPMSGEAFHVPENVYLVGTMNTADRSIALLDTALRRRFGFVELMPDYGLLAKAKVGDIPLGAWLEALNARICEHVGRDGRNLQVGHAYFMEREGPITDFSRFSRVVQDEIIPLLEEYCYEDWGALERILGRGLVDGKSMRVCHELFESSRQQELVQALRTAFPDLAASGLAIAAEVSTQHVEADDEEPESEADGA